MTYTEILFDPDAAGFVQVTIHRPQKLNALGNRVMAELDHAFQCVEREYRGLILTGAGERAFVAGADVEELSGVSPLDGQRRCERDQAIMRRLETMGKPSIAAINGYALGGGLELALCCSLRLAASTAKLGLPEAKIGVFPANGGTQRLPRLVGRGRALEMMLTGAPIDAQEAWRIGLVNRVVEPAGLLAAARGVPGIFVDYLIVDPDQGMTYNIGYDPALSGEARKPESEFAPFPFSVRKTIARRPAIELRPGAVINVGFGVPDGVMKVAREQGFAQSVVPTIEQGPIGGIPAEGLEFGAAYNSTAILGTLRQFAWYQGRGVDIAFRPLAGPSLGRMRAELFAPALLPADCFPAFQ